MNYLGSGSRPGRAGDATPDLTAAWGAPKTALIAWPPRVLLVRTFMHEMKFSWHQVGQVWLPMVLGAPGSTSDDSPSLPPLTVNAPGSNPSTNSLAQHICIIMKSA